MNSFWDRLRSQWNRTSDGAKWDIGEFWRRIPLKFIEPYDKPNFIPLGMITPSELFSHSELSPLLSMIKGHEIKPDDFATAGDFLAFNFAPPQEFLMDLLNAGLRKGIAHNKIQNKIEKEFRFVGIPRPKGIEIVNAPDIDFYDFITYCRLFSTTEFSNFKLLRK